MKNKTISARVNERTEQFLANTFKTKSAGAEFCLELMPVIYKRTLNGLKGRFQANELKAMIDTFNSTILTANIAGQHLHYGMSDAIELDGANNTWDFDSVELLNKTRELTPVESAMLEIWIAGFWQKGGLDVDEYVSDLTNGRNTMKKIIAITPDTIEFRGMADQAGNRELLFGMHSDQETIDGIPCEFHHDEETGEPYILTDKPKRVAAHLNTTGDWGEEKPIYEIVDL